MGTADSDDVVMAHAVGDDWIGWLERQGEMGRRTVRFDWASTPLGPIQSWSAPLRASVSLCLGSLYPMSVRWGDDQILLYNDACRPVYGEERFATALGQPSAVAWPETQTALSRRLDLVRREAEPFFAADRLVPINRAVPLEECYFTFSYSPILDEAGAGAGVFSTFIETTSGVLSGRRLQTLADLGESLSSPRPWADSAQAAMDVLATNPLDHPAGVLYGFGSGEAFALAGFGGSIPGERAPALATACWASDAERHDTDADGPALHAYPCRDNGDGTPGHVLVLAHHESRPWDEALSDYFGLLAAVLATAALREEELSAYRETNARLTALDLAKSAFFAGVSHELRTPLSLISAPVEDILDNDSLLTADSREKLRLVQDSVGRLSRMVEAMLDFSRMEAGRLSPSLQPSDVAVLTRGFAASFAPAFERAGLEFESDIPTLSREALLDFDFLERIVSNLLANALKYTPQGRVGLRLAEESDAYVIEVTDTGLGIDPVDHERVFARFERLPPRPGARSATGAGIGLAMVRELTELMDGEVGLESSLGRGSRFTVRLPFVPSRPAGLTGQSITPRPVRSFLAEIDSWTDPVADRAARGERRGRLLIVEDDPQLARFLAGNLSAEYDVTVASHGLQALKLLRGAGADLVLTDRTMPSLDGVGLVRAIRSDPALRTLPVIMLSSSGGVADAADGLKRGADDYISKPFSLVDLRGRLAANLARARERSADAAWRRAVMSSLRDPIVILDGDGTVLELNDAFTSLLGYRLSGEPLRPPYPWWPVQDEEPGAPPDQLARVAEALHQPENETEALVYTVDRRPVWVHLTSSRIEQADSGRDRVLWVLRDITRDKQAQQRRSAAAEVSAEFARMNDLAGLVNVAQHGFDLLFDGESTIQLDLGERYLFNQGRTVTAESVAPEVAAGLAGSPSPDATSLRPGILLVPQTGSGSARAWVAFPKPRRIHTDEMVSADLIAQAFGLAVERIAILQEAADRRANLELAIESHRLIGQAVGILVERHRWLPKRAFDELKQASQARNVKLRTIAERVIETGMDPDQV